MPRESLDAPEDLLKESPSQLANDGLRVSAVLVNDKEEHLVPPVRTVDIARPELGRTST